MSKPIINSFSPLTPLLLQSYERYIPNAFDESLSILEKMNKMIYQLNETGELVNEVVEQWNAVMEWILNEGLEDAVNAKLEEWLADGTLEDIFDQSNTIRGMKDDANYFNPSNNKWYQDSLFTTLATDNTPILQAYLDTHDKVVIPSGSYRVGTIQYKDNQVIEGSGGTILRFDTGIGVTKNFPVAVLTNKNQPSYHDPDDVTREYHEKMNQNVVIRNLTLDGSNVAVWCMQSIAVDNITLEKISMINAQGGLDLRATTNSHFIDLYVSNITDDGISLTDQNFKPNTGKRGITTNLLFENCYVTKEGSNNDGGTGKSAYEMDDGMSYITFKNCTAINNNGIGFEAHIHTTEYDMHHITFDGCKAINNTPLSAVIPSAVCGFAIGQCPDGSYLGDFTFLNCESIGNYVSAFRRNPGSQTGYAKNITIDGGNWETTFNGELTRSTNYCCIWLGKFFDNVRIVNANIKGCKDAYGIYTYDTAGRLIIEGNTFTESHIPIDLNHDGGDTLIDGNIIYYGDYVTVPSSAFVYVDGAKVTFTNNTVYVDGSRYSASILRFQTLDVAKVHDNTVINTGTRTNNAIYIQDNIVSQIINNVLENFTNGVWIAGTNQKTLVALNNCYNSTAVSNIGTATGLTLANNVI